jgi:gentisate 1,2-dioxygenase
MSEEHDELLWESLSDAFNQQPRPNNYVDDAGYDEAASEFIDRLVELVKAQERKAISRVYTLANDYANADKTMRGSEQIRGYHYFNALNTVRAELGEDVS